MADISKDQLLAAATAQSPALFNPRNNAPEMDEAKAGALRFVANGFKAVGLSVEGYEDEELQADEGSE